MEPNYSELDSLKIGHCFAPGVISQAYHVISNIANYCDTDPLFAIQEIEEMTNMHDELLRRYRNSDEEEKHFRDIDEQIRFMTSVAIQIVLQGVTPIIEEYRRGDLDGFVREWFPIFLKSLDGFKKEFAGRVHPKRWFPAYFENPVIFARNSLEWMFERLLKEQQKLKPSKHVFVKKLKSNDKENEDADLTTIIENNNARKLGQKYEDGLFNYLNSEQKDDGFFFNGDDTEKHILLRPYKDDSENEPRRYYYKTNQIADLAGCTSRILRAKYLPSLIEDGFLTENDVYKKKTDNIRYPVWRICLDSRDKVVGLIKAKLNESKPSRSKGHSLLVNEILANMQNKTPDELSAIESQLVMLPPGKLEEAWEKLKNNIT